MKTDTMISLAITSLVLAVVFASAIGYEVGKSECPTINGQSPMTTATHSGEHWCYYGGGYANKTVSVRL